MLKRSLVASMVLGLSLVSQAIALPSVLDGMDPTVRPQDDLFAHANGGWIKTTPIPGDKSSYGAFDLVHERAEADVRAILDEAARSTAAGETALIGTMYASLLDESRLDRQGLTALRPELRRLQAIRQLPDVAEAFGRLARLGAGTPVGLYVTADSRDPGLNIVTWTQGGLGLPDREYYLASNPESAALRQAYQRYLTRLLTLSGAPSPARSAREVLAFERRLAHIQWSEEAQRDPLKTYNPTPRAEWTKRYGAFPWERFAASAGMPARMGSVISQPSYFQAFSTLAAQTPMATWRAYLRVRLLDAYAENLSAPYRAASFAYHGQALNGLKEPSPRWRVAIEGTSEMLGEAIGKVYVARRFPESTRTRVRAMVDHLFAAYRESLSAADWMSPTAREAALAKLATMRVKIGYPDRWRGYAGLTLTKGDGVGNLMRAQTYLYDRDMAEAGGKVDRSRWYMTPQTVNAYFDPTANEIVFPAAILQKPFFDPQVDDAYNYGNTGATIGHEISHGFDDEGRLYDAEGKLRNWWLPADEAAFKARADRLVRQFDAFEALPGLKVNGKLTLGENLADLNGTAMALKAYHRSLGAQQPPMGDGLTGEQRFFVGYAQSWREKIRQEALRTQVLSNPHAPAVFRTNGIVANLDAFHAAFGVKPGDKLYRLPEDRVHLW